MNKDGRNMIGARYVAKNEDGKVWVFENHKTSFLMALTHHSGLRIVRVPEEEVFTEISRVGYTVQGRFWSPPMSPFYWVVPPVEEQTADNNTNNEG